MGLLLYLQDDDIYNTKVNKGNNNNINKRGLLPYNMTKLQNV